jgi:hypothetical protein
MSAGQEKLFETKAETPRPKSVSAYAVNSVCQMCDGSGWRLAMIDARGDRRVTRCECWLRRHKAPAVRDYKAAAAGER